MIYIASDHAGIDLKDHLVKHLQTAGLAVEDCGAHALDREDDYPDFIYPCALKVAKDHGSMGIVIGGSGQGEAIVANKVKGIRAALYYGGQEEIVKLSRQHNNANILSLGARFLTSQQAQRAVDLWIETGFDAGRHERRVQKISELENN